MYGRYDSCYLLQKVRMLMCRTCLSKNDLKPIFADKNLVTLRSQQLYIVCGIKIEADDGYPQLICVPCSNIVNEALKLREQSLKSEEIYKTTFITIKIEPDQNDNQMSIQNDQNDSNRQIYKKEYQCSKEERINSEDSKNVSNTVSEKSLLENTDHENISNQQDNKNIYTVRIEDFESSNDSDFMNNFLINNINSIYADNENSKICIEDYESNDSTDEDGKSDAKDNTKEYNQMRWDFEMKELLEKGRRNLLSKEQDEKLLSLAETPYDSGGPIKCKLCSKEIRNLQNFKCHAKTHFEPPNTCEECGKKFINPSHMRYHQQRMHGRKKRLACATCNYRAVDIQQLRNHVRAKHTGERPYICDVCGDTFRMRYNIVQHMRKHFGVRNLQCERCPAMFRSRSELTGHQSKVHYHIYTYMCYLCPETYRQNSSVRKHLANAHGVPRSQQLAIKCDKTRRRSCEKSD